MIAAVIAALTGRAGALLSAGLVLVLLGVVAVQNGRINGWPLSGGGYKAQVAALELQAARAAADKAAFAANAEQAIARTQAALRKSQDRIAAAYQDGLTHSQSTTQTIIRKVPTYVSAQSDAACLVPWGAVRLLDAAASGSDPGLVAAAIAPGQPDGAASDVKLSEAVALLAADLGIARQNADQLEHLEQAVRP